MNIFELINKNVVTVSEDIHALMADVTAMKNELAEVKALFNAPVTPNASGEAVVKE